MLISDNSAIKLNNYKFEFKIIVIFTAMECKTLPILFSDIY